jgi:hypothetical protein
VFEVSPVGDLAFLVTKRGLPFSIKGLGNKMRQWCNEAQLYHCSAHGLRKVGAVTAAENGATTHMLMSIFGWLTIQEAERYTREASRRKIAGQAIGTLVRREG